jgi:hypothetical protein
MIHLQMNLKWRHSVASQYSVSIKKARATLNRIKTTTNNVRPVLHKRRLLYSTEVHEGIIQI